MCDDFYSYHTKVKLCCTTTVPGAPSRPLFPVTEHWSQISTNSWVALNGR